jgi:hypothetical protein
MADIELTETAILGDPAIVKQYKPTSDVDLTASGGATPSAQSEAIDIRGSRAVTLTIDHDLTGSDSTDLDADVFTSYDGSKFDNEAYCSLNLGAANVKSIPLAPGPAYIRWKVTNNDAGNATKVRPVVTVVK